MFQWKHLKGINSDMYKTISIGFIWMSFLTMTKAQEAFYKFSGLKESLKTEYHTSEGVLLNIGRDTLIHIFRLDSTKFHISNRSVIVKRYSYNKGLSWSSPSLVYNSPYDDRNVTGIVIGKRIIVVFRRLDGTPGKFKGIDIGRIYSDDMGKTWSKYLVLKFPGFLTAQPFGTIVRSSDGYYNLVLNRGGHIYICATKDGNKFILKSIITNRSFADETAIAYIGKKKMIALIRDDNSLDSSYLFYRSSDNGYIWTYKGRTKMNNNQPNTNRTAPFLVWDSLNNSVIAISTQRHMGHKTTNATCDSFFWYSSRPKEAFDNKWKIDIAVLRPNPNTWPTYGYPTLTQLSNGKWVGIITERHKVVNLDKKLSMNLPEHAYFYQFYLYH